MTDWIKLHKDPRVCFRSEGAKQEYYHQRSRQRWLDNQGGHATNALLSKCIMAGKIGRIDGFALYENKAAATAMSNSRFKSLFKDAAA